MYDFSSVMAYPYFESNSVIEPLASALPWASKSSPDLDFEREGLLVTESSINTPDVIMTIPTHNAITL